MAQPTKRYAIVTGGNKGIGLEICRQLALTNEVLVVLTARDENKDLEAGEKLKKESALSDHHLLFHQLDVLNPQSVASLADFIRNQFGKLDILVNNAGIIGATADSNAVRALSTPGQEFAKTNWSETLSETYEKAEECVETNYYGAKRMVEAFIPFLQLSDAPRIVNVSSSMGKLQASLRHSSVMASSSRKGKIVAAYPEDDDNVLTPEEAVTLWEIFGASDEEEGPGLPPSPSTS